MLPGIAPPCIGEIRELRARAHYLAHAAGWLAGVSSSGTPVLAELVARLAKTEPVCGTLRSNYGVTVRQMKDATGW